MNETNSKSLDPAELAKVSGGQQLQGGAGPDELTGGAGADILLGGGGDDVLDGGAEDEADDRAEGGAGNDTFIWAPGDGNDTFRGGEGQDTLYLATVVEWQLYQHSDLRFGLHISTPGVTMHVDPQGYVTFTDARGQPATISGTFVNGYDTLTFENVERLRIEPG